MMAHVCRHSTVRILGGGDRWCSTCGAVSDANEPDDWDFPYERGDFVFQLELPKLPGQSVASVFLIVQGQDISSAFAWVERLQRHRMLHVCSGSAVNPNDQR